MIRGPNAGQEYPVEIGVVIGRIRGDIQIKDSKVSAVHASIGKNFKGELVLMDEGSSNGILVDGQKVRQVVLTPGVLIQIGRTLLKVIEIVEESEELTGSQTVFRGEEPSIQEKDTVSVQSPNPEVQPEKPNPKRISKPSEKSPSTPSKDVAEPKPTQKQSEKKPEVLEPEVISETSPQSPVKTGSSEPYIPSEEEKRDKRLQALSRYCQKATLRSKDGRVKVEAFQPMLMLEFISGIQRRQAWVLGYGPRVAGTESVDLPIREKGAPGFCFEILPNSAGPKFKTKYPNEVLLNGQPKKSDILNNGDIITINDTMIKVVFDYEQN